MKGFLQRLAAQAMGGSTNTLRSAARTPYAAPLSLVDWAEPGRQAPALDSMGNERQHRSITGAQGDPAFSQEQHHVNRDVGAQPHDNEVTP